MLQTLVVKEVSPVYAQLVIGPPGMQKFSLRLRFLNLLRFNHYDTGSGKTTYCHKNTEFLKHLGRKVTVVNLDPANENMDYECSISIMNLITVEDAMEKFNLGPNGALMYCMEFLESNFEWLHNKLKLSKSNYFMFDCPGQVELYTHHNSIRNIFTKLQEFNFHLCTVHLVDSHYCSEPHKFISTVLLSLNTMLQIGLPHVNVLSKADLFKEFESKLSFSLEYYTDVLDLQYLLEVLNNTPGFQKYKNLNSIIVSMVEDYSLVSFLPLDINEQSSLVRLKNAIDKANGYVFSAGEEKTIHTLLACAVGAKTESERMETDIDPYA